MKNRSLSISTLIAALIIVMPTAWATHRSDAEQAVAAARAAHDQAASAQVASPETAAMIQEAEELIASRQFTKVVEIADKARMQDTFAYEQAKTRPAKTAGAVDADSAARQALTAAEAARKQAASVGGEWRDTAQLIKDAEVLAKSGQYDEAIQLANQAERQGQLGYEQALAEKGADFPAYVTKKP
jgi:hypothetical protein